MAAPEPAAEIAVCWQREFGEVNADASAAPWVDLPTLALRESTTGELPQQATRLQIGWTADELRVLFHCTDAQPWATLTERDAPLYEEEVVEVFLDPVGDLAAYFEIEVNPLNAVLDLALRRNRSGYLRDFAWCCDDLRTAVRVAASSWTAELAIPFRSLTAEPPQPGNRWRGNFFRIDRLAGPVGGRSSRDATGVLRGTPAASQELRPPLDATGVPRELSAWSPTGCGTFHVPQRFGVIEFRK